MGGRHELQCDSPRRGQPAKRNGRRDMSLISRKFREIWGWGREIKKRNLGEKKRNSDPGQVLSALSLSSLPSELCLSLIHI